jgi:hypothetical protein
MPIVAKRILSFGETWSACPAATRSTATPAAAAPEETVFVSRAYEWIDSFRYSIVPAQAFGVECHSELAETFEWVLVAYFAYATVLAHLLPVPAGWQR